MNFILVCVIQPNETFLSNTRKLFWFENSRMLIAVFKKCCVIYYNFRYTFVICEAWSVYVSVQIVSLAAMYPFAR